MNADTIGGAENPHPSSNTGEAPAVERRPGAGGQGNVSECKHSSPSPHPPACALQSADLATRHGLFSDGSDPFEVRRNRRAPGVSAGEKYGDDGRLRSELTCFAPVGGDRQIVDCSAVNLRHCHFK